VVAAAFSFGGYPHSPEFPCKSGQRYSNNKKARETEWTKNVLSSKHERHAHLELVHAFGECGKLCKSVLGDITMIMSQ
jgi:hypothetical protein